MGSDADTKYSGVNAKSPRSGCCSGGSTRLLCPSHSGLSGFVKLNARLSRSAPTWTNTTKAFRIPVPAEKTGQEQQHSNAEHQDHVPSQLAFQRSMPEIATCLHQLIGPVREAGFNLYSLIRADPQWEMQCGVPWCTMLACFA